MHRSLPYDVITAARASLEDVPHQEPPDEASEWADVGVAPRRVTRALEFLGNAYEPATRVPDWTMLATTAPRSVRYGGTGEFVPWTAIELVVPGDAPSSETRREFEALVAEWMNETATSSKLVEKLLHPAYMRIIGMGKDVLPLILEELRREPAHWFVALRSIAGEDPGAEAVDFDDAVDRWLEWGRRRGLIS